MKKLLLFLALVLSTNVLFAQIKFHDISVADAVAKAKSENKIAMIIGSATWCGPCTTLSEGVFLDKEVGDYVNSKFVAVKYELDKKDEFDFADTYQIIAYPTFVFIGADGVELTRYVGMSNEAEKFMWYLEEATKYENSWVCHAERYKEDPSYVYNYMDVLRRAYRFGEANVLLNLLFEERSVEENFTSDNVEYYRKYITDLSSPIIVYMINNIGLIDQVLGQGKTQEFLDEKVNKVYSAYSSEPKTIEYYDNLLKIGDDNEVLQTVLYDFMSKNKANLANHNTKGLCAGAKRFVKKADSKSRFMIFYQVYASANVDMSTRPSNKEALLALVNGCLENETEETYKLRYEGFKSIIEKY